MYIRLQYSYLFEHKYKYCIMFIFQVSYFFFCYSLQ